MVRPPSLLLSEQPEYKGEQCGEQDAGGEREVEGEPLPFDVDVAGESPQPGEFAGEAQNRTDGGNQNPQDYH